MIKNILITLIILNNFFLNQIFSQEDKKNMINFDTLWNYDDPKSTEEKFLAILNDSTIQKDNCYTAELMTQIARTQGLQMKFDEAHKTLDDVQKLINDECKKANVRYLLERGRTFNSSKHPDEAKKLFLQAYDFGLSNNFDYYAIDAAHMMGIVEKDSESLRWNDIAIKLAEKSSDEMSKKWLGPLYNNTAWTYFDMGKYDVAMDLFQKNVRWHEDMKSKMPLIIAKWSVARMLRAINKVKEALDMQMKLIDELKVMGLEQDGYVFEEIGENLLLLNRAEESKPYFKSAYDILSKDIWMQENEKERLERMKKLSM